MQIVCQYQTNSNYNTQDKSLFLQLSVISVFLVAVGFLSLHSSRPGLFIGHGRH